MRSINFRFVGISLLCVLLICGAVHAVHVMQFEGHLRFLQTMAQEADESGDESGAIGLYRRYVTLSRTDADAYERLAELLMDSEQFSQAQSPLNQALRLRKDAGATETSNERILLSYRNVPSHTHASESGLRQRRSLNTSLHRIPDVRPRTRAWLTFVRNAWTRVTWPSDACVNSCPGTRTRCWRG